MSLEPAAAAIAGLLVLGQHLPMVGVVALVLVTLASAGVTIFGREPEPVAPEMIREPVYKAQMRGAVAEVVR